MVNLPTPKVLIPELRIRRRVSAIARKISSDYRGREITVIYVSNGALFFAADLCRQIRVPMRIDCISASSYKGRRSSGKVSLCPSLKLEIKDRHVLIVDDILDSGITLGKIVRTLEKVGPASMRICVLLDKKVERKFPVEADYAGFEIQDVFVYGYGLDYDEYCRNLPYVAFE